MPFYAIEVRIWIVLSMPLTFDRTIKALKREGAVN